MSKKNSPKTLQKKVSQKLHTVTALETKVSAMVDKIVKHGDRVEKTRERYDKMQTQYQILLSKASSFEASLEFLKAGNFPEFRLSKDGTIRRVLDAGTQKWHKVTIDEQGQYQVLSSDKAETVNESKLQERLQYIAKHVDISTLALYERANKNGSKLSCMYAYPTTKKLTNGDTIPFVENDWLFSVSVPADKSKQAEAYARFTALKAMAGEFINQLKTQAQA